MVEALLLLRAAGTTRFVLALSSAHSTTQLHSQPRQSRSLGQNPRRTASGRSRSHGKIFGVFRVLLGAVHSSNEASMCLSNIVTLLRCMRRRLPCFELGHGTVAARDEKLMYQVVQLLSNTLVDRVRRL